MFDLRKVLIAGTSNGDTTSSNGSGKTNLCEAIGFAVWGQTKADTLDMNVKEGTDKCSVTLEFEHDGEDCVVTRTVSLVSGTTLTFTRNGKPSGSSTKSIIDFIKIDYLTYVNSVYLRQDDMFSLANQKKNGESREVIERVLNLQEYDKYETTADKKYKDADKLVTELTVTVNTNKDLESKIMLSENYIKSENEQLSLSQQNLIKAENEYSDVDKIFSSRKESLVKFNALGDRLKSLNRSIESKKLELESNKSNGKTQVANRERTKTNLETKIAEKSLIEADRDKFLADMEENYKLQQNLNELSANLETEKQNLKILNQSNRTNEINKVSLGKDAEKLRGELDSIGHEIKHVSVSPGQKCTVCKSDVTEHNIELIKAEHKENYEKKHFELETAVKALQGSVDLLTASSAEVKAKEKIISGIEVQIEQLRPKIISKKQYENSLQVFSDKLSQIDRYKAQLEDLPETKIIAMLGARIATLKMEIAAEEQEEVELKKEIDGINMDSEAMKKLETEFLEAKNLVGEIQKGVYLTSANIANEEKILSAMKENLAIHKEKVNELSSAQERLIVLEQLRKAFSSKGVRAKILEDAIRDLEKESDTLLRRLTNGRLSLTFVTQKSDKVVFEVHINDGTKILPFSLYSGGEKFRIAFVLRIALSKLLLRKANSKLEFLIIDEAVSPLDQNGVENIMGIINELQEEFKTILVITHRNDIKNQFDKVITVYRDEQGSKII